MCYFGESEGVPRNLYLENAARGLVANYQITCPYNLSLFIFVTKATFSL